MSKIYKAALIGCGNIGTNTYETLKNIFPNGWMPLSHAEAMRSLPNIRLDAICDTNEDNLNKTKITFPTASCYTNYQDLLDQETDIDILSIATRTPPRTDILMNALSNRSIKAMHIEKPLCQSIEQTTDIISALDKNNIFYTYGTLRRYMASYRKAKTLIQNGDIGNVTHITVEHGVTTLMWNHPHAADLLVYFSGSTTPVTISANCTSTKPIPDGLVIEEDLTLHNMMVEFDNGVRGYITSAPGMCTRVYGDKGFITIGADGGWVDLHKMKNDYFHDAGQRIDIDTSTSATQFAFQNLIDYIDGKHPTPVITGSEIIASQQIIIGCAYSAQNDGTPVEIKNIPSNLTLLGMTGKYSA